MIYLMIGLLAFGLFIVYDLNQILWKKRIFSYFFVIGNGLIIFDTILMVRIVWKLHHFTTTQLVIGGIFAGICLWGLLYTLFGALPFHETYGQQEGKQKVCTTGIYALCRHPGVLWFGGFYFAIAIALNSMGIFIIGLIFNLCNIGYVIFQDRWTFQFLFDDYKVYQETTPFLLPTWRSFKRCIETIPQIRR